MYFIVLGKFTGSEKIFIKHFNSILLCPEVMVLVILEEVAVLMQL